MTTFKDAIDLSMENDIEGFKTSIDDILLLKVGAALDAYRPVYAATLFSDQKDNEDQPEEVVSNQEIQEPENENI